MRKDGERLPPLVPEEPCPKQTGKVEQPNRKARARRAGAALGAGGQQQERRTHALSEKAFFLALLQTQSLQQMENEHHPSALTMDFPVAAPVWVLPQYLG